MVLVDAIEEFLLDGRAAGWSGRTEKVYGWHLERWRRWLDGREVTELSQLTRSLVKQWAAGLRDAWAPATCKGATTAIRSFLAWCQKEEFIAVNLAGAVRSPQVPRKVQRTLKLDELERLIAACETPVEHGLSDEDAVATSVRNAALVTLLFDSLIRASELCKLAVSDVDLDAGRLLVRSGKGGDDRIALFSEETAKLLRAWLALRAAHAVCSAFFVSVRGNTPGQSLTVRGLRIIVKNLGERAGVAGCSPHAFRRGGAVALTRNGAPGRIVMGVAGWSSMRMLETYTRAMADQDIETAYRRYSPVATLRAAARGEPQPA